jgi:hypothetical protein
VYPCWRPEYLQPLQRFNRTRIPAAFGLMQACSRIVTMESDKCTCSTCTRSIQYYSQHQFSEALSLLAIGPSHLHFVRKPDSHVMLSSHFVQAARYCGLGCSLVPGLPRCVYPHQVRNERSALPVLKRHPRVSEEVSFFGHEELIAQNLGISGQHEPSIPWQLPSFTPTCGVS